MDLFEEKKRLNLKQKEKVDRKRPKIFLNCEARYLSKANFSFQIFEMFPMGTSTTTSSIIHQYYMYAFLNHHWVACCAHLLLQVLTSSVFHADPSCELDGRSKTVFIDHRHYVSYSGQFLLPPVLLVFNNKPPRRHWRYSRTVHFILGYKCRIVQYFQGIHFALP